MFDVAVLKHGGETFVRWCSRLRRGPRSCPFVQSLAAFAPHVTNTANVSMPLTTALLPHLHHTNLCFCLCVTVIHRVRGLVCLVLCLYPEVWIRVYGRHDKKCMFLVPGPELSPPCECRSMGKKFDAVCGKLSRLPKRSTRRTNNNEYSLVEKKKDIWEARRVPLS